LATRTVLFYEIRATRAADVAWRLDVPGLVAELTALPDAQRIRLIESDAGDSYEFVQVLENGGNPAIVYVRCRDHGLPMLAQAATLEPLNIAAGRQLAELTHTVFFDRHIVGSEYNHYGPRLPALAGYLADKVPQCLPPNNKIRIVPLINEDRLELLRNARSIKGLSLKMAPELLDVVDAIQHLNDGREALKALSTGYGVQRIGLDLQNRNGLNKDQVVALVDWAFEQGAGLLSTAYAVVQLDDGTTQPINLLKTRLGVEREMELIGANARSIDHGSAQTQIVDAYHFLEDQLHAASTVWGEGPEEDGN